MIGYLIIIIVASWLGFKIMGLRFLLALSSIVLFFVSFEIPECVLWSVGLFIVWFISMSAGGVKMSNGRSYTTMNQQMASVTKKQKKEEEDWGIIDFSEKK